MERVNEISILSIFLLFSVATTLSMPVLCWAKVHDFDGHAVFCLFYGMSGGKINEQDIEDLCFRMGKPIYSSYKPSELFVKNSQNKLRKRLLETMNNYDDESVFKWKIQCDFQKLFKKNNNQRSEVFEKQMPQPTPFIMAKISQAGQKSLTKLLRDLQDRVGRKLVGPVDMGVYLKPERIEYHFEKRNIALENVTLPLRYIVLRPIKVEILSQ